VGEQLGVDERAVAVANKKPAAGNREEHNSAAAAHGSDPRRSHSLCGLWRVHETW
jgi:hypothetical protein